MTCSSSSSWPLLRSNVPEMRFWSQELSNDAFVSTRRPPGKNPCLRLTKLMVPPTLQQEDEEQQRVGKANEKESHVVAVCWIVFSLQSSFLFLLSSSSLSSSSFSSLSSSSLWLPRWLPRWLSRWLFLWPAGVFVWDLMRRASVACHDSLHCREHHLVRKQQIHVSF